MDDGQGMHRSGEALTVNAVLDRLVASIQSDRVSVAEIVQGLGERSFAPLLLLPALILVSPVSSIPGMPTMGALIMGLVTVQMLFGRSSLWLPRTLARRSIPARRMCRAVKWLRRPAGWVDRHVRPRLLRLTRQPLSSVALLTCLAVTLVMPLMEFVPMLATVAASAITLFAIGLMTLDGAYIIAGYAFVSAGVALAGVFF
ncbi:hypothetical protein EV663_11028 [Rhodovulum bhavnagarense]|uniref:Exopolysaccharide synthesis protein ExoD n=1 Tax=Rhodovulum bhavnagarense TaxID=992286 RepID=A0A4R2RDR5_9RHOB|nr:exopolysaccharide biosynthesis protein [Rhodovulum bhavnagarense]TCP60349.1 hypothetical protein EV663_11028 [Rhodovulum bhavnagarense]